MLPLDNGMFVHIIVGDDIIACSLSKGHNISKLRFIISEPTFDPAEVGPRVLEVAGATRIVKPKVNIDMSKYQCTSYDKKAAKAALEQMLADNKSDKVVNSPSAIADAFEPMLLAQDLLVNKPEIIRWAELDHKRRYKLVGNQSKIIDSLSVSRVLELFKKYMDTWYHEHAQWLRNNTR